MAEMRHGGEFHKEKRATVSAMEHACLVHLGELDTVLQLCGRLHVIAGEMSQGRGGGSGERATGFVQKHGVCGHDFLCPSAVHPCLLLA
jgi:hypothetical protein